MEVCVTLGEIRPGGSAQTQGGRRHRLQSQHRHFARVLSGDREHAHISRPPRHDRSCPSERNVSLQRRNHRPGRIGG
jgi:hypothetical protein